MKTTRNDAMTRPARPSARQRGFSFIEILIVMGIISVLVGGIVVAIGLWQRRGPEFATKNTISKTKALIENWKTTFEMYPPSDITRIGTVAGSGGKVERPANRTNDGIEAVYQALYWPGFRSDPEWGEDEVANTDEDELRKAVSKYGGTDLKEIRDAWGHPLVYFHRDDYVKYADEGVQIMTGTLDVVYAKPYRNEDGTFVNPSTFQLWSIGEDGEPNTPDDVLSWK